MATPRPTRPSGAELVKRVYYLVVWSYSRKTNRSVLMMTFQRLCQEIWLYWFLFTNEHVQQVSWWSQDFPNSRYFLCTLSVLIIYQWGLYFWAKPNHFHYRGEQFGIWCSYASLGYLETQGLETPEKVRKSMLVNKIWLVIIFKKCFLKSKIIKTGRISSFVIQVCLAWCCEI